MAEKLSLSELKAQNAALAEAAEDKPVDDIQEEVKDEYVQVEEAVVEGSGEEVTEDEVTDKSELESWQLTDEAETSESEKEGGFVPNSEAAKRRKKAQALKGELKEKDNELEELKRQVEALKAGNAPQAPTQAALVKPTREQFDYDDDAYDAAMEKYYDDKLEQKLNSHTANSQQKATQEAQQQQAVEARQKSLNSHYERAQKLVDDGKVTEEAYKNADSIVRRSLDNLNPGNGDMLADALISTLDSLGEGSEKVMYQLGVNPAKMQELQNRLSTDPSGLSASAYLGQLQLQAKAPGKKRSQAPKPAAVAGGEAGGTGKAGTLQKQYNALEKEGDIQGRIRMKRQAKRDGIDVSNW